MISIPAARHRTTDRSAVWSRMGVPVYGLGAMMFGIVGLVSGDFAAVWQPVPAGMPGRKVLAYIVAFCFLGAGAAIPWSRFARFSAIVLGALYFVFALLWIPRVLAYPRIFATWNGVFEQLALAAAAVLVYASARPGNAASGVAKTCRIVFGICAVSFALGHFFAIPETAAMVPRWIPPGQRFWAVATGVAHLLAGIAIVSGVLAIIACRCLTFMLILFGALVWLPALLAQPHAHTVWCGSAINLAMAGAAWVVADWLVADWVAADRIARQHSRSPELPAARESMA